MRRCSNCGSEYQDWVESCIDCGTKLTDEVHDGSWVGKNSTSEPNLTHEKKIKPEKIVTVATFGHPEEAYLNRAKLESEGIWSMVADDRLASVYSLAVGGIKLQVNESDWEEAARILGLRDLDQLFEG